VRKFALMPSGEGDELHEWPGARAIGGALVIVAAPLVLLAVPRLRPALDVHWENQPAHFWLVVAAAAITVTLGYRVTVAARRRQDARLFLISLAFITGAGFLGLHGLATPGVLVGPNAGFELATPVGLGLGSVFVAISAIEFRPQTSRRIMRRSRPILGALVTVIVGWAWSPSERPRRRRLLIAGGAQGVEIGVVEVQLLLATCQGPAHPSEQELVLRRPADGGGCAVERQAAQQRSGVGRASIAHPPASPSSAPRAGPHGCRNGRRRRPGTPQADRPRTVAPVRAGP
jgi:hypothetical protein